MSRSSDSRPAVTASAAYHQQSHNPDLCDCETLRLYLFRIEQLEAVHAVRGRWYQGGAHISKIWHIRMLVVDYYLLQVGMIACFCMG
ncbi:hypothetical protein Plhal304r1_c029g0095121 [Plasmopara halstedii]